MGIIHADIVNVVEPQLVGNNTFKMRMLSTSHSGMVSTNVTDTDGHFAGDGQMSQTRRLEVLELVKQ